MKDEERGYGNMAMNLEDNGNSCIYSFICLVISQIAQIADGDARSALNLLEICIELSPTSNGIKSVNSEILKHALQRTSVLYDKKGEEHYNVISALHKSMRGSDVDASLYWMARMLEGGEEKETSKS